MNSGVNEAKDSPLKRLFLAPFCMAVLAAMITVIVPSSSADGQRNFPVFLLAFVFLIGNYWAVRDKRSRESAMLTAITFSVCQGVMIGAGIFVMFASMTGSWFFPLPLLNLLLFTKRVSWWKAIIVMALTWVILIAGVK